MLLRYTFTIIVIAAFSLKGWSQDSLSLNDANLILVEEELAPPETYEHIPDVSYELAADRISCIDTEMKLSYNSTVKSFIDYFSIRDREYTKMMIERMNLYFPIFEYYLEKHQMPEELKYLAIVESGLNPKAKSRVGAAGLWQFMPATGKMYKLRQDYYIDERLDPYMSTEAACLYLKQLHNVFNDWELALASYNAGPGKVRRAIRKSGYKKDFWEVYKYLPRETRSYLPQFVAVTYLLNYRWDHNFSDDLQSYPMRSDTIMVTKQLDMNTMATQLNVCLTDLQMLNPAVKRNVIPARTKPFPFRVPIDKMEYIAQNRTQLLDSAAKAVPATIANTAKLVASSGTSNKKKVIYKVRSGDVVGSIAERYKVRASDIRQWNRLRGNLIRAGQNLTIWVNPSRQIATATASRKAPQDIPGSKTYMVQPGDTLWDISNKYKGLTIEKIKKLNNLPNSRIKPGQKLIIG